MKLYHKFQLQTLVIAIVFLFITIVVVENFSEHISTLYLVICASFLAVVMLSWRLYRGIYRSSRDLGDKYFRQTEALIGLYGTLNIQQPLPRTRGTAASPDFLQLLATEIFQRHPETIVEVGSGASTLIAAYCLKKMGHGRIISLDHLEQYADITHQTIQSHGLENYANVYHAPLKGYKISDGELQWYDDSMLEVVKSIDMLIVDGPPEGIGQLARFPAVPLLFEKINKDTVVLLDDGDRPNETKTVSLWEEKFGLKCLSQPMEKGAFVCSLVDK